MRFDSTMEAQAQRHKELLADNVTLHSLPKLKINRSLEKYGRAVYTHENFFIFPNELWVACMDCDVEEKKEKERTPFLTILDNSEVNGKLREVVYDVSNHATQCSWKMFEFEGIPCQHIFCVLKGK